jgi:hypothetical protein
MVLALFSLKNTYHKNGIWWFTKAASKIIGENRYAYQLFNKID